MKVKRIRARGKDNIAYHENGPRHKELVVFCRLNAVSRNGFVITFESARKNPPGQEHLEQIGRLRITDVFNHYPLIKKLLHGVKAWSNIRRRGLWQKSFAPSFTGQAGIYAEITTMPVAQTKHQEKRAIAIHHRIFK